jgi:hypothetical protein
MTAKVSRGAAGGDGAGDRLADGAGVPGDEPDGAGVGEGLSRSPRVQPASTSRDARRIRQGRGPSHRDLRAWFISAGTASGVSRPHVTFRDERFRPQSWREPTPSIRVLRVVEAWSARISPPSAYRHPTSSPDPMTRIVSGSVPRRVEDGDAISKTGQYGIRCVNSRVRDVAVGRGTLGLRLCAGESDSAERCPRCRGEHIRRGHRLRAVHGHQWVRSESFPGASWRGIRVVPRPRLLLHKTRPIRRSQSPCSI